MGVVRCARVLALVATVALVAAACSDDDDGAASSGTPVDTAAGGSAPTGEATTGDGTTADATTGDGSASTAGGDTASTEPAEPFAVVGPDPYDPPDPLPAGVPGDLIWAQEIGQTAVPGARAWRILYLSESRAGDPVAVSGYVLAPDAEGTDRPIVSYAHGTTGSADHCAPSRGIETLGPTEVYRSSVDATLAQYAHFVEQGYVVAGTDYQGLGVPGPHPYLHGPSEGRGVIDAARAAAQLPGTGAGNRVVFYGLSQGGQAALYAGELATDWAPELEVLGTVAAAPFSEVDQLLPLAGAIPGVEGYYVLATYGQVAANPDLDISLVLDQAAIDAAGIVEEGCIDEVQQAYATLYEVGGGQPIVGDPLTAPGWAEQMDEMMAGLAPSAGPIMIVQGEADTTVPAVTTRALVERLCADDQPVEANFYPETGHGDSVVSGQDDLLAWIDARVAGEPAPDTCPA
jgi:hypothetical protein